MPHNLSARFTELAAFLRRHEDLWRPIAFHDSRLPWRQQYPDLSARLLALSPEQIDALGNDNDALYAYMATAFDWVAALQRFCTLEDCTRQPQPSVEPRFFAGIPGRKWQQVERFAGCLPASDLPVLEWCAGKSHLGFLLQRCTGRSVTALEWNPDLVRQANTRAAGWGVSLHSHRQDVLQASVEPYLQPQQQAVALHACGDLHARLLVAGAQRRVQAMAVAPCCFHKIASDVYRPLSEQARQQALPLTKSELHLAVMETVTAGQGVRRQREQLQAMRLGFDCLQRDIRGVDAYLPLPSLPASWGRVDFHTFCRHCAALKGLSLPNAADWNHDMDDYLQRGRERFHEVAALDLVRFLFRRPLEIWLVLDRALYLQEQGYRVELGTFCSPRVTPRNILLLAQRVA